MPVYDDEDTRSDAEASQGLLHGSQPASPNTSTPALVPNPRTEQSSSRQGDTLAAVVALVREIFHTLGVKVPA